MDQISKLLADLMKGLGKIEKGAGPLLFTGTVIVWGLVFYIYIRGIRAYLREKGKELMAGEVDKLDDLGFIRNRTDDEEKEFKALKAKRDEMKKESVLPYYIGAVLLLAVAVAALVRSDLIGVWLQGF